MMISGQNIICFGSERWEYPGFQQTVMRNLSKENRIIYVNPIGTREISFRISEFSFYINRALRFFQKNGKTSTDAIVCNPWIIPIVYNELITKCNRHLIRIQFSKLLSKLDFKEYILWIGTPTAYFLVDLFEPILTVYNPVDRYYAFPFVDSAKIQMFEKEIASKSDVVVCTSEAIRKDILNYNKSSYTSTHGVEFDHFNSVIGNNIIPQDIKNIRKPIIGYFGGLSHRVNYRLIKQIAISYPHANIVLIGKRMYDLQSIEKLENVDIIGYRDYNILPHYLKLFSVCIVPYHVNELMEGVDPIKLREYLCLGKPVVSVDLPEVRKLGNIVYVGENEKDFIAKVGEALKEDSVSLVEERIRAAKKNDWNVKMKEISKIVISALSQKEK